MKRIEVRPPWYEMVCLVVVVMWCAIVVLVFAEGLMDMVAEAIR